MTRVFDTLLHPLRASQPFMGLMAVSMMFGVVMILIFKYASNQQAIGAVRRRMGARALGMLLHLHSPAAVTRTAAALMGDNFVYLWMILRPMLVIAVPFVVTAAQLDARYGKAAVQPGETATVTITWHSLPERELLRLSGTGLHILEPLVMVDTLKQTSFNVINLTPGAVLNADGASFPVGASAGGSGAVVYRGAERRSFLRNLTAPQLAGLPSDSPVSRVSIFLPAARYRVLGGRWSGLAVFRVFRGRAAAAGAAAFRVKV